MGFIPPVSNSFSLPLPPFQAALYLEENAALEIPSMLDRDTSTGNESGLKENEMNKLEEEALRSYIDRILPSGKKYGSDSENSTNRSSNPTSTYLGIGKPLDESDSDVDESDSAVESEVTVYENNSGHESGEIVEESDSMDITTTSQSSPLFADEDAASDSMEIS